MNVRTRVGAVLAALAIATTTLGTVPADADARVARPPRYVAMGDSYSAATGVLPTKLSSPPECLRSARNYPSIVAARLGARLVDVTCGAADTSDYRNAQQRNVPPQYDALGPRTRVVTMTIGGNDSGVFVNSILQCAALGATTLGTGSPCKDTYGDQFVTTVRQQTFPAVKRALRGTHARAPRAEVAILTYPWILPRRVGCFDKMPVARGDVPYLRNLQRVLNNVVRRAADATGSTVVDLNRFSDGHDACTPIGTRWIEPVAQGTNPVVVHPNALGERAMARRTLRVLSRS